MRTLIAAVALIVTVNAQAVVFDLDWRVDTAAGEFLFRLDSTDGSLTWNVGSLWVSDAAAANAVIPGQTMLIGGTMVVTPPMVVPYFAWPAGATTPTTQLQTALFYDPALEIWRASGGSQKVSLEEAAYLAANQGVFRLDDLPSNAGVLSGPVQHAPEPQTFAFLAGLGLLGLAAYRRWGSPA